MMSLISRFVSVFWNDGMIPIRPVRIVERTCAFVAAHPPGRIWRWEIPLRNGGWIPAASFLPLWHPPQCVSNKSCPRAISRDFLDCPKREHPDSAVQARPAKMHTQQIALIREAAPQRNGLFALAIVPKLHS